MKKGVLISTTEHLLSAFIGMGVDNAIVELDNLEVPILDGSALPFVEMMTEAGSRSSGASASTSRSCGPTNCTRATSSSASIRPSAIPSATLSIFRIR